MVATIIQAVFPLWRGANVNGSSKEGKFEGAYLSVWAFMTLFTRKSTPNDFHATTKTRSAMISKGGTVVERENGGKNNRKKTPYRIRTQNWIPSHPRALFDASLVSSVRKTFTNLAIFLFSAVHTATPPPPQRHKHITKQCTPPHRHHQRHIT